MLIYNLIKILFIYGFHQFVVFILTQLGYIVQFRMSGRILILSEIDHPYLIIILDASY